MIRLNTRGKIFVIITLTILVVIVFAIVKKSTIDTVSDDMSKMVVYNDPWSGEQVISMPNAPDNGSGDVVTLLGFTKLLDIGVTYNQLQTIQGDFRKYASSQEKSINEISIDISTIKSSKNNSGKRTISFTYVTNRETKMIAKITYTGLGTPSIYLYNSSGSQIYKS